MSEKSELINKLKTNKKTRQSYVRAKINVNLPSQIRALRLKQKMKQEDLAREAEMMQPRISAMERPGATKFNIETLIRLAAAFKVGLVVKFVSFSEMLRSENEFNQDIFNVVTIDDDVEFQQEEMEQPAAQAVVVAKEREEEQQSIIAWQESVLRPESKEIIFSPMTASIKDFGLLASAAPVQQRKKRPGLREQLASAPTGGSNRWTPLQLT